jgi:hypothetical protein
VNWSAAPLALVPPGVVTLMSTVPEPAGDVAVICPAELTVKPTAGVEPKLTALALLKFVPTIVTLVPPAAGPDEGLTPMTVGGDGAKPIPYGLDATELAWSDLVEADTV